MTLIGSPMPIATAQGSGATCEPGQCLVDRADQKPPDPLHLGVAPVGAVVNDVEHRFGRQGEFDALEVRERHGALLTILSASPSACPR